jgi:glycosyltransferase involved in cell wall biosynthesis
MPWHSYREICRRFDDVHLLDSPWLDAVVERLSSLQRYGLSIRQQRALSSYNGRLMTKRVREIAPDILLSVGASHKVLAMEPTCPVIHVSDGLFSTMAGYYDKYGRFGHGTKRDAHADHQTLLNKTAMTLFASEWARTSALQLYEYPESRTRVVPFGANIDEDPGFRQRGSDGPLTLLFLGYDWKRKGGSTVLATWRELRKRTDDAQLHIVGCSPPEAADIDGVTVHGRLNKAKVEDRRLFDDLFNRASFFFMPSRQEAFGMVFCEAAAYGVPSIATETGGVPTSVVNGVTGLLLPIDATAAMFADRILDIWNDKPRYLAYSFAARARYETTLNWQAWGTGVAEAIALVTEDRVSGLAAPTA